VWIGAGFHRVQGRPQFSEQDREVARAFLLGASPLFEAFHAAGKASGPFLATLTSRQREMVYALLEGFSAKEIAARLGLTTSSVNTYCKRLYRALGVSGRGELVRLCNERGVFVDGGKAGRGETSA
jgi:DNA-binding NarL/FixJ family response regulator